MDCSTWETSGRDPRAVPSTQVRRDPHGGRSVRIGVDACTWRHRRGFGRFTRELLARLVADHGDRHEFVLLADRATAAVMPDLSPARIDVVDTTRPALESASSDSWRSPADLLRLGLRARRLRADVFLFPTTYAYYPIPSRVPVVVVAHDAMTEVHPDLFFSSRRARYFWQAKIGMAFHQATAVVSPSRHAQRQVAAASGRRADTIHLIEYAPSAHFGRPIGPGRIDATRCRLGLPETTPLLLYVGGISPHKNLEGLLRALAAVRSDLPWHLVIVGEHERDPALGCHREVRELSRALDLHRRTTFTGYVPDEDLAALYSGATSLVLPSFDEGFGLPPVEAMASGLPVVATNRGAVPEVVGDAGILFDPGSRAEMTAAVERILSDDGLCRALGERGRERAARYSWERTGERMMAVLHSSAEG